MDLTHPVEPVLEVSTSTGAALKESLSAQEHLERNSMVASTAFMAVTPLRTMDQGTTAVLVIRRQN